MLFAVNGTLMRGLGLNHNMLNAGATFVREERTAPTYRLWSIKGAYPAMVRVNEGGVGIALELWEVSAQGLVQILEAEPPGLTVGRVQLANGVEVLGVLAEPYATQGETEITEYGGWRAFLERGDSGRR